MTNNDVYAAGMLNKALDPSTQPDAIRAFLHAEESLVAELIRRGARVVDFGCGTGRHLIAVLGRISLGVKIDYEMGHEVIDVTDECIVTRGGFISEHFTEDRLRSLVGECSLRRIGTIAYVVQA